MTLSMPGAHNAGRHRDLAKAKFTRRNIALQNVMDGYDKIPPCPPDLFTLRYLRKRKISLHRYSHAVNHTFGA